MTVLLNLNQTDSNDFLMRSGNKNLKIALVTQKKFNDFSGKYLLCRFLFSFFFICRIIHTWKQLPCVSFGTFFIFFSFCRKFIFRNITIQVLHPLSLSGEWGWDTCIILQYLRLCHNTSSYENKESTYIQCESLEIPITYMWFHAFILIMNKFIFQLCSYILRL